jgi:hypothetical protein
MMKVGGLTRSGRRGRVWITGVFSYYYYYYYYYYNY